LIATHLVLPFAVEFDDRVLVKAASTTLNHPSIWEPSLSHCMAKPHARCCSQAAVESGLGVANAGVHQDAVDAFAGASYAA
jgi:hypothetical protein